MAVLLAGGAGFIGSHTAVELLGCGYDVVIADNLYNCDRNVIDKIKSITGKEVRFYEADAADNTAMDKVFEENPDIDSVVHFAGYKAVGESVEKPLMYYRNNLDTTLTLLETMKAHGVHRIVFSSSATVYGMHGVSPLDENSNTGDCSNPYGWTKWMIEQILMDVAKADPELSVMLLRYFNPVGAHESGLIGEKPNGIPNNLMPYICQVATGKLDHLNVFGDDYDTPDGTGVRDFIHVVDLAKGHVAAIRYIGNTSGCDAVNLGTGVGYSVLDLVKAFERVNGISVPYEIVPRRAGDLATVYSSAEIAKSLLGWTAEKTLDDMCRDSYRFMKKAEEASSNGRI